MARAVPSRLAEFTAGRTAARAAMRALGLPEIAVPMGPDRAPVWPNGVVGSIAHTNGVCVALIARAGPITGIGVDLEPADPLPADLWPTVLTAAEMAMLDQLPKETRGQTAKLLFSAKESTYKCIYPQSQTVLDFSDMEIRHDTVGQSFSATLLRQAGPFVPGTLWRGNYAVVDLMIATVMVLR